MATRGFPFCLFSLALKLPRKFLLLTAKLAAFPSLRDMSLACFSSCLLIPQTGPRPKKPSLTGYNFQMNLVGSEHPATHQVLGKQLFNLLQKQKLSFFTHLRFS